MVRNRRRGVYPVTRKGRRYWEFKVKDPYTGEWFTKSVSKKMLVAFDVEPSGADGTITEKDAQTARTLFERALEEMPAIETRVTRESTPLSELFERYIEARCTRNGPSVIERKRAVFDDFIALSGDLPAHEVTDRHAAAYLRELLEKGTRKGRKPLSASTARDYFSYVKAAFKFGRHVRILGINPAEFIELPEKPEPQTPIWAPAEIRRILDEQFQGPRWEYFRWIVVGAFVTGMSPMEWQRADWENYDPERRSIWLDEVKKKSSAIRRTEVPVPALFAPAFEARRRPSGPIWPSSTGQPLAKNAIDPLRRRVREKWEGFNFLSLRTSYSVFLQDRGVFDMQLARLLRHGDGVESGYRVARRHYSRRRDFEMIRGVADEVFGEMTELLALIHDDDPGPQLRIAHPA